MKAVKTAIKILKFIFIGILLLILLFNLIGIAKRIFQKDQMPLVFGFGISVVTTGSMEPTISPGDVIIIRKQNEYNVDDIVTFKNNSYITHRIVEKTADGYITKGDANNANDKEIKAEAIVGKTVKTAPLIGHLILFIKDPLRLLVLAVFLIAIFEVPAIVIRMLKEDKKEQ